MIFSTQNFNRAGVLCYLFNVLVWNRSLSFIFLSITLCLYVFSFVILIFKSPMGLLDHRTLRHFSCWLIIELEHWIATFLRIHQMNNTLAIKRMRTKCGYKCFWCGQYTLHTACIPYAQITPIYLYHLPGLQHRLSKLLDWYSRLKWLYLHINVWNKCIAISHTLKVTNKKEKK